MVSMRVWAAAALMMLLGCTTDPVLLKQGPGVLGANALGAPPGPGEVRLFTDRMEFTPAGGKAVAVYLERVEAFQLDIVSAPGKPPTKALVLLDTDKAPLMHVTVENVKEWTGPLSGQLHRR